MAKIKSVTPTDDGIAESAAEALWSDIEGFAQYSFNKSHTYAYGLISYQAMYLKTYHPLAFYAASMTVMPSEKLLGLMMDAKSNGVTITYPDINRSTDRFEISYGSKEIVIPFQRVKGVSNKTAEEILRARASGPFLSKQDFVSRVNRRICNVRVQDALEKIGAFASVDPMQPSANDPCRIKDQVELIPGLVSDFVPVNRDMHRDKATRDEIMAIVDEYRAALGPVSGGDGMPCKPHFGRSASVMIITDAPSSSEEAGGVIGIASYSDAVQRALQANGMTTAHVYWTSLIKRPKRGTQVSPEEITLYKPYLDREIAALQPTVIVTLGTQSSRTFIPTLKGKVSDMAGKVVYFSDIDANVVVGFSPGEIWHDASKMSLLEDVFAVVKLLTD
jgi:DNA polymerase III subunit alpha